MKDALETAAVDDERSLSSLVQKILREWLRSGGYMKWLESLAQTSSGALRASHSARNWEFSIRRMIFLAATSGGVIA